MRDKRHIWVVMVVAGLLVATAPASAEGDCTVVPLPAPEAGPDILRQPPATAPELENEPPFAAEPLLVGGTEGYDRGEYLYQDFIWDDHGAKGGASKQTGGGSGDDFTSARPVGTFRYPTDDARFANNAADLLELRIRPAPGAVRYRISLNTLLAPDTTAATIAIAPDPGGDPGPLRPWPYGSGIDQPLGIRWFIVHAGTRAVLVDAVDGSETPLPDASVDLERNHLTVSVPTSLVDPGTATWRYYVGVGLWDPAAGRYLQPQTGAATATTPGNAAAGSPAFFNVGFRFAESLNAPGTEGVTAGTGGWADTFQARGLEAKDISPFRADVDFAALAAGVVDRRIPTVGTLNRIYPSRFATGEGIVYTNGAQAAPPTGDDRGFVGSFRGRLMVYSVRLPASAGPGPPGLLVAPHPGGGNHNSYGGMRWISQLGEERGAIVFTPYNRGGRNLWFGAGEAQAFEAWADLRRRYDYDPSRVALAGYSNGGWATYKLGVSWPDLFGAAFVMAGPVTRPDQFGVNTGVKPEDDVRPLLPNVRTIPYLIWHGTNDTVIQPQNAVLAAKAFEDAGLRYQLDLFPGQDHLSFAVPLVADQWGPARDFLGLADVAPMPSRVSFAARPRWDYPAVGIVHDGAWWLSGVRVRTATFAGGETGRVDARSRARGDGDPVVQVPETSLANEAPSPSLRRAQRWAPGPATVPANRLDLTLANVEAVTVHLADADLDGAAPLELTVVTDGAATVRLGGLASGTALSPPVDGATLSSGPDGTAALALTQGGSYALRLVPPTGCGT